MTKIYANNIIDDLKDLSSFVLAIDGNAGSGKTTLSYYLAKELNAILIHMDDFYLPIDKREFDWFEKPAGNIDFKRIENEIVRPYLNKEDIIHNIFNPRFQKLECIDSFKYNPKIIIEGSYSMHPCLKQIVTHSLFLMCDEISQEKRLKIRENDNFENFKNIWIVKELNYHKAFNIKENADYLIDTSNLF